MLSLKATRRIAITCRPVASAVGRRASATSIISRGVSCRPSVAHGATHQVSEFRVQSLKKPLLPMYYLQPHASHRSISGQSVPSHYGSLKQSKKRGRKHLRLPLDDCKNIDEVLNLTISHLDNLPPNQLAAAWSFMLRFLPKADRNTNTAPSSMQQQQDLYVIILNAILKHTMNSIKSNPKDLTTMTFSMAKIATNVQLATERKSRMNIYQRAFGNVLLDENSKPREDTFNRCAKGVKKMILEFEPRHLSNISYAYALLGYNPTFEDGTTLFECAGDVAKSMLDDFEPRGISIMMWSFATNNVQHQDLFRRVADHIVALPDLTSFGSQSCSNLVWAYTKSNMEQPGLFMKIGNHIADYSDNLTSFESQELSNLVYSYAKAGMRHSGLFHMIGDHIASLDHLRAFKPMELSNIVWAYASSDMYHPKLFESIGKYIVESEILPSFNTTDLANLVWAYAAANQNNPSLFEKVGHVIVELSSFDQFTGQGLANIVWAYAKVDAPHRSLFRKIGDAVVRLEDLESFDAQALSNILWAFASSEAPNPSMFNKVGNHIVSMDDLKVFTPQALSNIVWAYANAGMHHPALFEKMKDHIVGLNDLTAFQPQDYSNIVWAYATVNDSQSDLFEKIRDTVADQDDLTAFSSQSLANLAWSFAVANVDASSLFDGDFRNALLARQMEFNNDELRQLWQWNLWQTEEKSHGGLPEKLRESCRHTFFSSRTTQSRLQKDVVKELISIGLTPDEEYRTPSGYSIDALIEVDRKHVALEVDGPFHFIDRKPIGPAMLKRRQITLVDKIQMVSVPYWEWDGLGKDRDKKQEYLRSLLGSIYDVNRAVKEY